MSMEPRFVRLEPRHGSGDVVNAGRIAYALLVEGAPFAVVVRVSGSTSEYAPAAMEALEELPGFVALTAVGEPAGSRCKVVGRCVVNLSLVDRFSASPSKTYVHFGPVAGDVTSLSVDETPDAVWDLVKPASAEGSVRS